MLSGNDYAKTLLVISLVLQPQIDPHPESFPHEAGRTSAL
jgi:hypothetical protein